MDNRLFFAATQRNKDFIGDVLTRIIPKNGSILEIGSGSGEHGVTFQKIFPEIIWQTSDPRFSHRKSIKSWIEFEELNNKMPQPLPIDVERAPWEISSDLASSLKGIISINVIHVASWNCTRSLFEEASRLLSNGQFLMLYGPFKIANKHTSLSNHLFDKSLKMQNSIWGVRNLEEVLDLGKKYGLLEEDIINMPANNFSIVFRKAFI